MISLGSPTLASVQLAATLNRLGAGASIRVYSTTIPVAPGAHTDTPMSTIPLANPAGSMAGAELTITPVSAALVMSSGLPRWAELVAGDGAVLHLGDVTDVAGDGFYQAAGAATPDGETSPSFVAGGLLSLGSVVFT